METNTNAWLAEFEIEVIATGRLLERLPKEQLAWRPHPKSMTLGALALHVATIPAGTAALLEAGGVEAALILEHPEPASAKEILEAWQQTIASALKQLAKGVGLDGPWSVTHKGKVALTLPKSVAGRLLMLNHWYHHRGQLTVYLRMLDVPLPVVYAASADENPFA